jgi:hypothetical protein
MVLPNGDPDFRTITLICMGCGKKVIADAADYDPPGAVECHNWCDECSAGGKLDLSWYYDEAGNEIRPMEE